MQDLQSIQLQIIPLLKQARVSRSFIFGSYARNEAHTDSDLDLLVSFHDKKTLLDLVALQLQLEVVLGMKVDIITDESLSPKIRPYVDREKIQIL